MFTKKYIFLYLAVAVVIMIVVSYPKIYQPQKEDETKINKAQETRIPGTDGVDIDPNFLQIFGYESILDHYEKKSKFSRGVWNIVFEASKGQIVNGDAFHQGDFHQRQFDTLMGPLIQCPEENVISWGTLDEEKRYCGKIEDFQNEDCVIVSVGCNGQFEFEEAMVEETKCSIEIFDCTGEWPIPENLVGRVRLHKYCLGGKDNEETMYMGWPSLLAKAGVTTAPDFVKMDIERSEYEVLYTVVESRKLLPKTVALELHGPWEGYGFHIAVFLDYMFRYGGYTILDTRDNPYSKCCVEVILSHMFILPDQPHPVSPVSN
jgi:hypothetical protein